MGRRRRGRRHHSWPEITAILNEYDRSELTQAEFCDEAAISVSSLQNWLRRRRKRPSNADLVPVHVAAADADDLFLEVRLRSGRLLRVPSGFAPDDLTEFVRVLED